MKFSAVISLAVYGAQQQDPVGFIYLESWAVYGRDFKPTDFDDVVMQRDLPFHTLFVNHAFLVPDKDDCTLRTTDEHADFRIAFPPLTGSGGYGSETAGIIPALMAMKGRYPRMKILPSLGGWSRSHTFSKCVTEQHRDKFMQSVVDSIKAYAFDGVDLDWEYPGCGEPCGCQGEGVCTEKGDTQNKTQKGDWEIYKTFLTLMRAKLDSLEAELGRKLYLTGAIGINRDLLAGGTPKHPDPTPLQWMCNGPMDLVNLMTYDIDGAWDTEGGHNAGLYSWKRSDGSDGWSVDSAMKYIKTQCGDMSKLVLGLPAYGRAWKGMPRGSGNVPGRGQKAEGNQITPMGTFEQGVFSIWDIDKNYLKMCTKTFDTEARVPTLHCAANKDNEPNIYISYDDEQSWREKMAYAKSNGLAGAIIWGGSDLGQIRTQYDGGNDLWRGLFSGWYGRDFTPNPPKHLGTWDYVHVTRWASYPCPLAEESLRAPVVSCPVGNAPVSVIHQGTSSGGSSGQPAVSELRETNSGATNTGNNFNTGNSGNNLNTGNTGNTYDTGYTGNNLNTGNTGNTYDTGNNLNTGNTYDTGNNMNTGNTGNTYDTGYTGNTNTNTSGWLPLISSSALLSVPNFGAALLLAFLCNVIF